MLCFLHLSLPLQDHCVLSFTCLEKQGRPGHVRGYLPVQKFEDVSLCPVSALVAYVDQVWIRNFKVWSLLWQMFIFRCLYSALGGRHSSCRTALHTPLLLPRLLPGGPQLWWPQLVWIPLCGRLMHLGQLLLCLTASSSQSSSSTSWLIGPWQVGFTEGFIRNICKYYPQTCIIFSTLLLMN